LLKLVHEIFGEHSNTNGHCEEVHRERVLHDE